MTRKKTEAYEVCVIKFGVGFHKDGVVRESEFYRKRKAAMNRYHELRTAYGILTDDIASDTRFWRQAYSPDIWVEIQETSKMNNLRTEHYKSAKQHLEANGVNFNKSDYFELSSLERDLILSVAKQCGYKKNYNPNCCLARQSQRIDGFFWLLKRL